MAADGYKSNGRDPERQSDLAVMDANEYKQKRRLERILDALDHIEDQSDKAWDDFVNNEITHDGKNIMIQKAVKSAIRECYNLLIDHHRECQDSDEDDAYWRGEGRDPLGEIEHEHTDDKIIQGLYDFLKTPEFYKETWTERVKPRNMPAEKIERERKQSVGEEISWNAALRLKEFLSMEHDLEIQFEEIEDRRPYDDWRDEFEDGMYTDPSDVELPHKNAET